MTDDTRATLVSSDVRRHNLSAILDALAVRGPLSRSEIAEHTGLTRGAVTLLAGTLVDLGLVQEPAQSVGDAAPVPTGVRRGRPRTRLQLAGDRLALLVLQLDADSATAVISTLAGDELTRVARHHGRPMGDPDRIIDVLADVLREAMDATTRLGRAVVDLTVIAFAPVGGDPTIVLADTDLEWGEVDLLGELSARVPSMPQARLVSDTVAAAAAELALRPGVGDLVYLKSNSGIGGALVAGGQLLAGAHGLAGALGHVVVDFGGALCECGQHGCLVTVAGPDVVLHRAGLDDVVRDSGLATALAEFVARVEASDPLACAVWADAAEWIVRTLRIFALALDAEAIVLGGYWAAPALAERIRLMIGDEWPTLGGGKPRLTVERSTLGDDAAIIGAIAAARDRLFADPAALAAPVD
ncbi:ROK family transcriptional regulator [Humibacter sp. RRB41]|uniref:ROK family transcriptional regulator n=1 Tax=Humibacter sp. RRB41 TaxID=2919946 RepID=UPI001FAB22EF|nr:ROK family transcriptional regulator [Humibacter sp. RRB41]